MNLFSGPEKYFQLTPKQTRVLVAAELSHHLLSGKNLVFLSGPAGCGKTHLAQSFIPNERFSEIKYIDLKYLGLTENEFLSPGQRQGLLFVDEFPTIFSLDREERNKVKEILQDAFEGKFQVVCLSQIPLNRCFYNTSAKATNFWQNLPFHEANKDRWVEIKFSSKVEDYPQELVSMVLGA